MCAPKSSAEADAWKTGSKVAAMLTNGRCAAPYRPVCLSGLFLCVTWNVLSEIFHVAGISNIYADGKFHDAF